jgi:hypothetical protein
LCEWSLSQSKDTSPQPATVAALTPSHRPIWGEPLWWDLTWNSTLQASFSQSNPLQFTVRGEIGLILTLALALLSSGMVADGPS